MLGIERHEEFHISCDLYFLFICYLGFFFKILSKAKLWWKSTIFLHIIMYPLHVLLGNINIIIASFLHIIMYPLHVLLGNINIIIVSFLHIVMYPLHRII